MEVAIATGPRIALLATFEPSLPSMKAELEQLASARKANIKITTKAVPAALTALQGGDDASHDTQIAAAAEEFGDCDALLLCQFSMAADQRIKCAVVSGPFSSPGMSEPISTSSKLGVVPSAILFSPDLCATGAN